MTPGSQTVGEMKAPRGAQSTASAAETLLIWTRRTAHDTRAGSPGVSGVSGRGGRGLGFGKREKGWGWGARSEGKGGEAGWNVTPG